MKHETLYVESIVLSDHPFELASDTNIVGFAKFMVMLQRDEDDFIIASCPALPGCYSQGRTRDEAIANISEAIRGYIVSMRKHGEPLPETDIEEVAV